ncbi:solute carrier family 66 member 3 [Sitodiplosis mosellana]|uniref:solute carrier family 66 member 3 n=1 Tax=Sitodiplosis mosellana TaxID=263140 RepID=UPI002443E1B1|nr:solute carrier family 66 member 3 [Sitodiplosis mosellana]XP_055315255.1 solute carrier family 66 member 3 [Sitodiplosis mosellana]
MAGDYITKGILYVISDILSLLTVALCLVQKLPQIREIFTYKSAKGISTTSLLLELFGYTVMMLYNYTYSYSLLSYLEYPILLVQEYVLVALVLKYKHMLNQNSFTAIGVYWVVTLLFAFQICPRFLLYMAVPFCTPIGATSKILQLLEILRTKNSATVSLTSWFLSAFTNLTRVYTTAIETGDTMLLINFTISFALSMSVYLAAFFYKPNRPKIFAQKKVFVINKD